MARDATAAATRGDSRLPSLSLPPDLDIGASNKSFFYRSRTDILVAMLLGAIVVVFCGVTLSWVVNRAVRDHGLRLPPVSLLLPVAAAYVLTAIMFGIFYFIAQALESPQPAFGGVAQAPSIGELIYFSFST